MILDMGKNNENDYIFNTLLDLNMSQNMQFRSLNFNNNVFLLFLQKYFATVRLTVCRNVRSMRTNELSVTLPIGPSIDKVSENSHPR